MKKTKPEIYNTLRAFLLILIFAIFTIFCIAEQSANTHIEAAEPAAGVGRLTQIETILEETTEAETTTARYTLTPEERIIVEAVVAAESKGESFDGQCLIAQCILNTAEATGKRPGVLVYEEGQYATPDYENHHLVSEAVSAVFDDGYEVTEEPVRYFYAPKYVYSEWHEDELVFVQELGGHRFFKEA